MPSFVDVAVVETVGTAVVGRDEGDVTSVGYLLPQLGQNIAVQGVNQIVLAAGQIGYKSTVNSTTGKRRGKSDPTRGAWRLCCGRWPR